MTDNQEKVVATIWNCLNHYSYADATFLAERLLAENADTNQKEEYCFLVATCYYRSNKKYQAYHVLRSVRLTQPESKFLLATSCVDLEKFVEAEEVMFGPDGKKRRNVDWIVSEYGKHAPFVLQLLAKICMKSEGISVYKEALVKALKVDPLLWSSFQSLCDHGLHPDVDTCYPDDDVVTDELIPPAASKATSSVEGMVDKRHVGKNCHLSPLKENELKEVKNEIPSGGANRSVNENFLEVPPEPIEAQDAISPGTSVTENGVAGCQHIRMENGVNKISDSLPSTSKVKYTNTDLSNIRLPCVEELPKDPFAQFRRKSTVNSDGASQAAATASSLKNSTNKLIESELIPSITGRARKVDRVKSWSNGQWLLGKCNRKDDQNYEDCPKVKRGKSWNNDQWTLEKCDRNDDRNHENTDSVNGQTNIDSTSEIRAFPISQTIPISSSPTMAQRIMKVIRTIGAGYANLTTGKGRKALKCFQKLPKAHRETGYILGLCGKALFDMHEYEKAAKYFERLRELEPHQNLAMDYYSTTLWHLRKETALTALADSLLYSDCNSPIAWCAMANYYSLRGKHELAVVNLKRAIDLDSDYCYAYTLLGHEYVDLEKFDKAAETFRKAIRINPRHYNAYYGLGTLNLKQGKYKEAAVHFLKTLSIVPYSGVVHCHCAIMFSKLNQAYRAWSMMERAMELDPENPLCKYYHASIKFKCEEYESVVKECEEVLPLAKESKVYKLMARAHRAMNNHHLAMMYYRLAADLDKGKVRWHNSTDIELPPDTFYNYGYYDTIDWNSASASREVAVQLRPNLPVVSASPRLDDSYENIDWDSVIASIEGAEQLPPDSPTVWTPPRPNYSDSSSASAEDAQQLPPYSPRVGSSAIVWDLVFVTPERYNDDLDTASASTEFAEHLPPSSPTAGASPRRNYNDRSVIWDSASESMEFAEHLLPNSPTVGASPGRNYNDRSVDWDSASESMEFAEHLLPNSPTVGASPGRNYNDRSIDCVSTSASMEVEVTRLPHSATLRAAPRHVPSEPRSSNPSAWTNNLIFFNPRSSAFGIPRSENPGTGIEILRTVYGNLHFPPFNDESHQ